MPRDAVSRTANEKLVTIVANQHEWVKFIFYLVTILFLIFLVLDCIVFDFYSRLHCLVCSPNISMDNIAQLVYFIIFYSVAILSLILLLYHYFCSPYFIFIFVLLIALSRLAPPIYRWRILHNLFKFIFI